MKISINIMKRHLYVVTLLVAIFLAITFAAARYANPTTKVGHDIDEIDWSKAVTMQDKLVVYKDLEIGGNAKFNSGVVVNQDIKASGDIYVGSKKIEAATGWPEGSYCILQKGGDCLTGFTGGTLCLDTEDNDDSSSAWGTLPDYHRDQCGTGTSFHFCCK